MGAPTLQAGAPTYKFARFSPKMHEIKKLLVCRDGAPPLGSTTALLVTSDCQDLRPVQTCSLEDTLVLTTVASMVGEWAV